MRITDLVPLRLRQRSLLAQNGAHEPARAPVPAVSFDPTDGAKRVLITVNPDLSFAPVQWFGMTETLGDAGAHEAAEIAAHGALICVEETRKRLLLLLEGSANGVQPDHAD
jgi:hypothetical protein